MVRKRISPLRVLKSQTRLQLPANCRAKIDGSLIEPTQEILDAVKSESLVGDKYIFDSLPELVIDTVTIVMPKHNQTRMRRAHEITNMSAPQVAGSVARLTDLVSEAHDAQYKYHSEMEMLASQIMTLQKKIDVESKPGWSWSGLFAGWKDVLLWIVSILVFCIVIVILFKICLRCCFAPAAVTAASIPLKGFAHPIPENTTHFTEINIGTVTQPNSGALSNVTKITNVTIPTEYLEHLKTADFHYDLIVAAFVMLFTIYWTKRFIMAEHRSMLARMGLFTRNLNLAHHMGESSLVIFFLAKSSSLCGSSHRVFEIPVELCTLPGQASSWVCSPSRGYRPIVSKEAVIKRHNLKATINLDFSNISLTSAEFPLMEGSSNIPTQVTIQVSHLTHILEHHVRCDWTSIRLVSVTGLAISFPGVFRYIYHYSKPGKDRQSVYISKAEESS